MVFPLQNIKKLMSGLTPTFLLSLLFRITYSQPCSRDVQCNNGMIQGSCENGSCVFECYSNWQCGTDSFCDTSRSSPGICTTTAAYTYCAQLTSSGCDTCVSTRTSSDGVCYWCPDGKCTTGGGYYNGCTSSPTACALYDPTFHPVFKPTLAPTNRPTTIPSYKPSLSPSAEPTIESSTSLSPTSLNPSLSPSKEPYEEPTVLPSLFPSLVPSLSTFAPTASPNPPTPFPTTSTTDHPSFEQTSKPTVQSTSLPTNPPLSPSQIPTLQPSPAIISPTARNPTLMPSTDFGTVCYSASSTNSALRNYATAGPFYICSLFTASMCDLESSWLGDTFLRLEDDDSEQVSENDDFCSQGSQIAYDPPSSCMNVYLHMGCYGSTNCSGCVHISYTTSLDTFPTILPTDSSYLAEYGRKDTGKDLNYLWFVVLVPIVCAISHLFSRRKQHEHQERINTTYKNQLAKASRLKDNLLEELESNSNPLNRHIDNSSQFLDANGLQPSAPPYDQLFDCLYCKDERLLSASINCTSGKNHRICQECFLSNAKAQLTDGKFPSHSRKIVCSECSREKVIKPFMPYEDNLAIPLITGDKEALKLYHKARDDATRCETESKAEAKLGPERFKHEEDILRVRMDLEQDNKKKIEATVALHCHRILNEVIVTKCPHCDLAFADWEHCFAVEHAIEYSGSTLGCRKFFCGYCLERFEDNIMCHRHVPVCPKNIRKPSVYGLEGDFRHRVEPLMREQKIRNYLFDLCSRGEVSDQVLQQIIRGIQKDLHDIGVDIKRLL